MPGGIGTTRRPATDLDVQDVVAPRCQVDRHADHGERVEKIFPAHQGHSDDYARRRGQMQDGSLQRSRPATAGVQAPANRHVSPTLDLDERIDALRQRIDYEQACARGLIWARRSHGR